jgi:hypothetical protein
VTLTCDGEHPSDFLPKGNNSDVQTAATRTERQRLTLALSESRALWLSTASGSALTRQIPDRVRVGRQIPDRVSVRR